MTEAAGEGLGADPANKENRVPAANLTDRNIHSIMTLIRPSFMSELPGDRLCRIDRSGR